MAVAGQEHFPCLGRDHGQHLSTGKVARQRVFFVDSAVAEISRCDEVPLVTRIFNSYTNLMSFFHKRITMPLCPMA